MYLSSSKQSRISSSAKARLNHHSHKLENIESRKRSPDGAGPPSPSEVIVFNTSGNGGKNHQYRGGAPEVPHAEEIRRFLQEGFESRMKEAKEKGWTIYRIPTEKEEREMRRSGRSS